MTTALPTEPVQARPPASATLPLVAHRSPHAIVAYRHGEPVTARGFLADVTWLAGQLPAGAHMFNACGDRYRFAVGLCAAFLAGKTCLLPPSHNAAMARQLLAYAPDTWCLRDDDADAHFGLPWMRFPDFPDTTNDDATTAMLDPTDFAVPEIRRDRIVAVLFTSGSTGTPVPHRKRWDTLVSSARASARRLGLDELGACTLVGTVPPQHMFGFEFTVMLALHGGAALSADHPFFPADIDAALGAVPAPRVLVTSPVHLRALMLSAQPLPPIALTLSATAPLQRDLAARAERQFGTPLREIYGSTETGHLATRRTAHDDIWLLLPGIALHRQTAVPVRGEPTSGGAPHHGEDDAPWIASGAHLDAPVALHDVIAPIDDTHFRLLGRSADLVKVAGKRTSLGFLNQQLAALDGVDDGAFFVPDAEDDGSRAVGDAISGGRVTRLVAVVVSARPAADLLAALRERIDPAFMPRHLVFADALPRDATGKLPRARLAAMARASVPQGGAA
jgi:acyl-coenzyme A synthetase/AMP-(fatty) acid ligase